MVQGYYTLEEAAQILKMATEELTQMAQKRQIRAFADRGTWRFRAQDVEEMARRRGQSSDEVQSLAAPPQRPAKAEKQDEVFHFDLSDGTGDKVDLGQAASPAAAKPGSDSDVKLVLDSDSAEVEAGGRGANKKTHVPEAPADSEAQLIPLDEPDALGLGEQIGLSASDSDIRLEEAAAKTAKRPEDMPRTEEVHIDLDKELLKADDSRKKTRKSASPFELSDSNLDLPQAPKAGKAAKPVDDTSDPEFDLSPTAGSSDEISLSEIELEEDKPRAPGGVNLSKPADSGIKLAKDSGSPSSSDEIEFELSLDSDSDADAGPAATHAAADESSSSEFELTLDDSGGLAPLEEKAPDSGETDIFETDLEVPALDEESGSEVVPLDESDTDLESSDFDFDPESAESGSQVVALDDEADDAAATVARKAPARTAAAQVEEDSGVAEVDEILSDSAEPDSPISELADDELAEPVVARKMVPVAAAPSNWGVLPAIIMLPCVLLMTLLLIMAFELLHDMWGYKQSFKPTGVLIRPIAQMFSELPPDQ
jgi:excisionase family DNA binding protein